MNVIKRIAVFAHHINHGLSENAQCWSDFCADYCRHLQVGFTLTKVQLNKKNRISLEALAREKRYHALQKNLSEQSCLVTAHHQDDQLETVLLALKRGSGITGLQGIQGRQTLSSGFLIRPLLVFSRAQLEEYASLFQLQWIEDESNSNQDFDRNFIRHSITPLLKGRWPSIGKSVARSAFICQEQQQILDELAAQDHAAVLYSCLNQQALTVSGLKLLSVGRRNNVLRLWFKLQQIDYPSATQMQAIWQNVVLAKNDATPIMQFKNYSLRRYRDHIYLLKDQDIAINRSEKIYWQGQSLLSLANDRIQLQLAFSEQCEAADMVINCPKDAQIEICFRSHLPTNLRCQPTGRQGSRSIKKLLHEYHVAPWLRDLVPFILVNGELAAAVGLWQCQITNESSEIGQLHIKLLND